MPKAEASEARNAIYVQEPGGQLGCKNDERERVRRSMPDVILFQRPAQEGIESTLVPQMSEKWKSGLESES